MISIRNVSKSFASKSGVVNALKNISLTVEEGEIYGVIGFSGAGKSTLIRTVNLLERPDAGEVLVGGVQVMALPKQELRQVRKKIGMIFQQFNLLRSKTVFKNIAAPLVINRVPKAEIKARVTELLRFVELEDKMNAYVETLSGGQKQRVGIARALATNPSILLCDEATSALDPKTTASILQLLKKINRELGVTILLITHEMNVIRSICHKVAVMEGGEIVERGEVLQVFGNPVHEITKGFVRTVIDDTIPESLRAAVRRETRNHEILKLTFVGENARDSLLSRINKQFKLDTTLLYANVSEMQETVLGIVIVQLTGEAEEIVRAKAHIAETGVRYERVGVR
jgi:D-methionine transport system ATP-binding protein